MQKHVGIDRKQLPCDMLSGKNKTRAGKMWKTTDAIAA
jgi:hypothetical protein